MTDAELKSLTLSSAATLIRRKELSPTELVTAVLARVDRLNERMRVYITVCGDLALQQARLAERQLESNAERNRLPGVPISVKDLFDTRGVRTTAGSRVLADRVPEKDAAVVARLTERGAVLVGKTNLHEFAFGTTNINPHYGTARNPWDEERIAGGSSGGSASSVALSLALGSLGTDTGGSIRIPASICGVVGLKPTYGLVNLDGVFPLSWSLDHAGPLTRTVEDTAVMLDAMAEPGHSQFASNSNSSYTDALIQNVDGLRIGIPKTYFFEHVVGEVHTAVLQCIRTLEQMGAKVVEVDLPTAKLQRSIFMQIVSPEAWSHHEQYLASSGHLYGADVRNRIETGRLLFSVDYIQSQRARTLMKEECKAAFRTADVFITPTIPILPPRIDETAVSWNGETETVYSAMTRFTRPFNITGLPAISIPCGFSTTGLPIGVQIVGRAYDESTVLRVADAYERNSQWWDRRPPLD